MVAWRGSAMTASPPARRIASSSIGPTTIGGGRIQQAPAGDLRHASHLGEVGRLQAHAPRAR